MSSHHDPKIDPSQIIKAFVEHNRSVKATAKVLKINRNTVKKWVLRIDETALNAPTKPYEIAPLPEDDIPIEQLVELRKRQFRHKKEYEEASKLKDEYISTEHLFLAILSERNTAVARILAEVSAEGDFGAARVQQDERGAARPVTSGNRLYRRRMEDERLRLERDEVLLGRVDEERLREERVPGAVGDDAAAVLVHHGPAALDRARQVPPAGDQVVAAGAHRRGAFVGSSWGQDLGQGVADLVLGDHGADGSPGE